MSLLANPPVAGALVDPFRFVRPGCSFVGSPGTQGFLCIDPAHDCLFLRQELPNHDILGIGFRPCFQHNQSLLGEPDLAINIGEDPTIRSIGRIGSSQGFINPEFCTSLRTVSSSPTTGSEFNVAGALNTFVFNLNDNGDFIGSVGDFSTFTGYVNVGGVTTVFSVPGSNITEPLGLNNLGQSVGFYLDSTSAYHGFLRDASGALTFPIDIAGATLTLLADINDSGLMVGIYLDAAGELHGFAMSATSGFVSFDYPGATAKGLNGINNAGLANGRYPDAAGVNHGFIARVR